MDQLMKGWFSEVSELWPGQAMSLEVEEVLHSERSEFQDIMVVKTKSHGRVLILDGIIQCSEKDEFAYQEMISFLPLCSHNNPKTVLIVGGGDGGVAREVAKHPLVEEIHQVEIDGRVVEVSKKFLPFMAKGFESSKLKLHIGDGFEYMKNHKNKFDVIITDSSDPIGPAVNLFQEDYFKLMKQALKENGLVCSQGSTIWTDLTHVKETLNHCKRQFQTAAYAIASVPTYPNGQIGFVMGSLNKNCNFMQPTITFSDDDISKMDMRYYSTDVHKAAFALPQFAKSVLYS
ncbi:spermidine Synthase isoform X1 [Arctopsyche grandis]